MPDVADLRHASARAAYRTDQPGRTVISITAGFTGTQGVPVALELHPVTRATALRVEKEIGTTSAGVRMNFNGSDDMAAYGRSWSHGRHLAGEGRNRKEYRRPDPAQAHARLDDPTIAEAAGRPKVAASAPTFMSPRTGSDEARPRLLVGWVCRRLGAGTGSPIGTRPASRA